MHYIIIYFIFKYFTIIDNMSIKGPGGTKQGVQQDASRRRREEKSISLRKDKKKKIYQNDEIWLLVFQ